MLEGGTRRQGASPERRDAGAGHALEGGACRCTAAVGAVNGKKNRLGQMGKKKWCLFEKRFFF
jgi:hypothetical protein